MLTEMEKLMARLRSHPAYRREIPMEAALSLPVPVSVGGRVILRFLVFLRGRPSPGTPPEVFRPYMTLGVDYESGRLVQYVDLRTLVGGPTSAREPLPFSGLPEAAGEGPAGYVGKRRALLELYPEIVSRFCLEGAADDESLRNQFVTLFDAVAEPGLRPYYEELNPPFFAWLCSGSRDGHE